MFICQLLYERWYNGPKFSSFSFGLSTPLDQTGNEKMVRELKELNEQYMIDGEVNPAQLTAICETAKSTLQKLDFHNKTAVIRELVDKVIIYGQSNIELWKHIPLNT